MAIDIQETIRKVFTGIEDSSIDEVMSLVTIKEFEANVHLCHQGQIEKSFYIIVQGAVRITKQREDGTHILLQRKEAGDYFGEMALVNEGTARTADVFVDEPSLLIELQLTQFLRVVQLAPRFALNLIGIVKYYRADQERVERIKHIIFTSYSRRNQKIVKRIVNTLKQKLSGHSVYVWLDQNDISAGKDWDTVIEKTLYQSTAMLLFLSEDSVASGNVKSEWNLFLEEGKTIIPVQLEECKIPVRLKPIHFTTFTNHNDESEFNDLIERLTRTLIEVAQQASH